MHAAGMSAGKGYVDVSTVDADTSREVAAAIRAAGASFLEAPVSGSKAPAEQGKLIFLTGGEGATRAAVVWTHCKRVFCFWLSAAPQLTDAAIKFCLIC